MWTVWLILTLISVTKAAEKFEEFLVRSKRATIPVGAIKWPSSRIPYIIDKSYFRKEELRDLQAAIDVWNSETCVHFVPYRRSDKCWIRITNGPSCYSEYVGYKGNQGEQKIALSKNGCRFYGLFLHELGHAVGLDHEHIRADRDRYLRVDVAGVQVDLKSFFTMKSKNQLLTYDSPYDIQSVMHYGQSSFSVFADKTPIEVKDERLRPILRDVYIKDVSFWDVRAVNLHYRCEDRCRSNRPACKFPGFIDKNCKCQTPSGFARRRCVDNHGTSRCSRLAEKLECYRNASFMTANCRKTCGFCYMDELSALQETPKIKCKDHHENCRGWAKEGHCTRTASYMKMMCPGICGYCNGTSNNISGSVEKGNETCGDHYRYPADCEAWAREGKCESNKLWMHYNCAKSCEVCRSSSGLVKAATESVPVTRKEKTIPCSDNYGVRNCQSLASRKMCATHKSWMMKQCSATCRFCRTDITTKKPETTTNILTEKMSKGVAPKAQTQNKTEASKVNGTQNTKSDVNEAKTKYMEYCKYGDPAGECPKARSYCKSTYIFQKCPNICKNCGPCEDSSKSCAALKRSGYCTYYPSSTIPICRKTCGVCV